MFGIDDEPISGVNAPLSSNNAAHSSRSIALNPIACITANKQKREISSLDKPSNNTMLLADSIQNLTVILAQALAALL